MMLGERRLAFAFRRHPTLPNSTQVAAMGAGVCSAGALVGALEEARDRGTSSYSTSDTL